MSNFHVGQKVVCVDAEARPGFGPWENDKLYEGQVYSVKSIHPFTDGDIVFHLNEIERSQRARAFYGPTVGYASSRFRPVIERKTDISVFTEMLMPKPAKIKQGA